MKSNIVTEEKEVKNVLQPRNIFLNNMNSWFSNFVIEELRNEIAGEKVIKNLFSGTLNNTQQKLPRLFEPNIITVDYNFHYESDIFKNDVFIFNSDDADLNELEYIIRGLKFHTKEKEKTLIIISNILTWAKTPLKDKKTFDKDEQEPKINFNDDIFDEELDDDVSKKSRKESQRYFLYTDNDYALRVPAIKYQNLVCLENLAINYSLENPYYKVYIICPGFVYGCGENFFYEYFKLAWYQNPPELPLLEENTNSIPTIHIIDLARTVKRVMENKPKETYILAVDKTVNTSLRNLIISISKAIGSGKVKKLKLNDVFDIETFPCINELMLNIKVKSSTVYIDEKGKNEENYEFKKRKFNWHSEYGIADNAEKIKNEFKEYRKLKNTRIFVTGPPGSGKTSLSQVIHNELKVPHLKIKDLIEEAKLAKGPIGDEVRAKQKEIILKKEEEYELFKKKNKNAPPFDRDSVPIRFPDDLINKIVLSKLNENICTNLGFVLDGYPRNSHEAKMLFFKDKEGYASSENFLKEKEKDEKAKEKLKKDPNYIEKIFEDYNNLIIDKTFSPMLIVQISCSDETIKSRLKQNYLANEENQATPYSEERIIRRLNLYKSWNDQNLNNLVGNISVFNLFKQYNLDSIILKEYEGNLDDIDFWMKNILDRLESVRILFRMI